MIARKLSWWMLTVLLFIFDMAKVEAQMPRPDFSKGNLKVADNQRYLVYADGTPFFWLGDTAWELFHRLDREEAELYFSDRAEKGFTVIQAVILAEQDGLNTPNPYGEKPLQNNDPTKPNEKYFQHVDDLLKIAEKHGLLIALLPTWGDKVHLRPGATGPVAASRAASTSACSARARP